VTVEDFVNSSPPLVSVVVVNYNGMEVIEPCLRSVFSQEYRPIEVIVVDNGSTDGSVEFIRHNFSSTHLIVNSGNLGFAGGNNAGVAAASGDYVVLLNNDTVVQRLWLASLVEMMQQPGVGVVTSKVITDGVPAAFYEMNGTLNYLGYNIMRQFRDLSQIFFAGGASLIFRRNIVGQPFLSEYFLYHEDVYLSWRMRLLGYDVCMAQHSVVHHRGSVAAQRQPSRLITFYQERNRLLNCLLFYEFRTLARLVPLFMTDAFAKLLLSLVRRRKSTAGIVRAYWWCVTHMDWIRSERCKHQSVRTIPDGAIMGLMSAHVLDSESMFAHLVNRVARTYAKAVGLAYHG